MIAYPAHKDEETTAPLTGSLKKNGAEHVHRTHFAHRRDISLAKSLLPGCGRSIPTGFRTLDDLLPDGGWPLGALTEILIPDHEPGSLWLALPAVARLSRERGWMAMVSPPHIPYAPALKNLGMDLNKILLIHPRARTDALWTIEEALGSKTCSSVLFWLHGPDNKTLRRLQLAAERGDCLGLCFRPATNAGQCTTAALRLRIRPGADGAAVDILKNRGGRPHKNLKLNFSDIGYA